MAAPRTAGKNALAFVLITVLINAIGFGIIIPVLPDLVGELTGAKENLIGLHMAGLTFIWALLQFIFMPIIGALSDKYGRRPIMLLSLFGLGIDYFLMAFAPAIAILYVGRAVSGAFGATFSTANAYIADVTPPERRAQNFGLVGAAFGAGFVLGPAIGGILGDPTGILGDLAGPRVPFFAAGVLSIINVIFGYIVLPETLAQKDRRDFSWARANALGALKSLKKIRGAQGLIFVLFLLATAHTVYPTTYTISMQTKLDWTSGDVGWSLFAFGIAQIIVQGLLIRWIIPKTGLFWAAIIGIITAAIGYAMMGGAWAGWVVYAAGPFAAMAGLYGPAINNMISSRLSKSEQGELQGAIGAAQGLAMMVGPILMGVSFFYFAQRGSGHYHPGAPFSVAVLLVIMAFIALILVTTQADRRAKAPKAEPGVDPAAMPQPPTSDIDPAT
ncbi:TCR/Tet family MFS transporter [Robiginitomaculum antarcticum]|uniref:TCR/Tet family MFS transporter n=1 Tax=Robiginitomaculum antarcticum TaxID=437507 RepID=UPI00036D58A4|nr:tetracycline resistance MFS efflux pump [Robiginitomaculum antarcticum]